MSSTFFYDLGSPYAWLAAERVDDVLGDVEWVPVLLGGIFKATGRSSWALTDGRPAGMAEIERRAAERGLPPVRWPQPWPSDGLQAMRAAVAATRDGRGEPFAREAFRVHFVDGQSLTEPAALVLAADRAGLDGASLLAATAESEVKAQLRANTDRALEVGVIGVPTVQRRDQLFWGDDQLEAAAGAR